MSGFSITWRRVFRRGDMTQLAIFVSLVSLIAVAGAFFFFWRKGFFGPLVTTNPTTGMPFMDVGGSVTNSRKCGEAEFEGEVQVLLSFFNPPPPRAEVRVKLEIRDRRDVTVSLDQDDLGIFRNDALARARFTGVRTNPCALGTFVVRATAEAVGPGATTIVAADLIPVRAIDQTVDMPTHISTTDTINFTLDIVITCCGGGRGHRVEFANVVGVNSLVANPGGFRCNGAGDVDTITITGKKDDVNTVGSFTVRATSPLGTCVLGGVIVE
jgi:hypothetical protein